jgi:hypothetical protein
MLINKQLQLPVLENRLINFFILIFFSLIGFSIFYTALNSYFHSDDYHTLAISRYIDNPVYLFGNHYPYSVSYRPIGVIFWWFSYYLFDLNSYYYYLSNLLLHIFSSYILYFILKKLTKNRLTSLIFSCIFLAHPLAISTAVWLSTRYDMLAVLFTLLSVFTTICYIESAKNRHLFCSLIFTSLAILSKELAYLLPIVASVIVITFPSEKINTRTRLLVVFMYSLLTVALLIVRYFALKQLGGTGYFAGQSLLYFIIKGYFNWLKTILSYCSYYDGISILGNSFKILFLILQIIIISLFVFHKIQKKKMPVNNHILLLGILILLLPGIVQAPVTNSYPFQKPADHFIFSVVVSSRFYYLSLIGILIIFSHLTTIVLQHNQSIRMSVLMLLPIFLIAILYGLISQSIASGWSKYTNKDKQFVEHISQGLDSINLKEGCKIYILNTQGYLHYFQGYSDVLTKAMVKNVNVIQCFIQTETTPYYYMLPRLESQQINFAPLEETIKPTFIGNLAFYYLVLPKTEAINAIINDRNAIFLEMNNNDQKIINVTDQIRAGTKTINFINR